MKLSLRTLAFLFMMSVLHRCLAAFSRHPQARRSRGWIQRPHSFRGSTITNLHRVVSTQIFLISSSHTRSSYSLSLGRRQHGRLPIHCLLTTPTLTRHWLSTPRTTVTIQPLEEASICPVKHLRATRYSHPFPNSHRKPGADWVPW